MALLAVGLPVAQRRGQQQPGIGRPPTPLLPLQPGLALGPAPPLSQLLPLLPPAHACTEALRCSLLLCRGNGLLPPGLQAPQQQLCGLDGAHPCGQLLPQALQSGGLSQRREGELQPQLCLQAAQQLDLELGCLPGW